MTAKWDLTFADSHEPFHHLPRDFLYNAPLPKTKFLSPYPNAVFDGKLEVGGETVDVDGWRGMIGHNWGAEHAERWVWVQGAGFEGRDPEDYFDMAVGRIKVAGLQTPWVGNAMLVLDGEEHRLGGFERIPSTQVDESPTGARFELKGKRVKLTGRVGAERKDFVAWIYADPVGPEHNTLNCSISDLELDVEIDGKPAERLTVSGGAAYEFGMRDTDHGIPVQPYPDGYEGAGYQPGSCRASALARRAFLRFICFGLLNVAQVSGSPRRERSSGPVVVVVPPVPTTFALTIRGETPRFTIWTAPQAALDQAAELGLHAAAAELADPAVVRGAGRGLVRVGHAAQVGQRASRRGRSSRCSRCGRRRSRRSRSRRPCPGRGRPGSRSPRRPGRCARSRRRRRRRPGCGCRRMRRSRCRRRRW